MDKSPEYEQFKTIDDRLCVFLSTHKLSEVKDRKTIFEYEYIWDLVEKHAASMSLDTTKYLQWLIRRSLAQAKFLPIDVEKRIELTVDINKNKPYTKLRGLQNGKLAFIKSEQKFNQMQRDGTMERMLNEIKTTQVRTQESL